MTRANDRIVALLMAAGQGSRAGGDRPKQFRPIAGKAVIAHAVQALGAHPAIDAIYMVVSDGSQAEAQALIGGDAIAAVIPGAGTRQGSVRAGLEAIAQSGGAAHILIHDAARPFLPGAVVDRLVDALGHAPGAIPVLPVADTLLRGAGGVAGQAVDRTDLYRVQTPQAFRFDDILAAHRAWDAACEATDDAQILKAAGHEVMLVAGDEGLEKLTYPQDFDRAEARLAARNRTSMGMGYDVHRLVPGAPLWLAGLLIPHDHGLAGHSDADVALHALVDALLGALAEGDIGSHFPPGDAQWRGADSSQFLRYAGERVVARGGRIDHLDLTIVCEAPKIGPHRDAMRARIADILGLSPGCVSVKATTTEGLGFTGRREGIAAQAVATISLPALS